ncbi:hypothetical protein E2562_003257 [Oryza meyeriana var. granulata]|uniref:Uncharacterized protein n=1 Tax=Oryza meyeriana var. granulata TaxID=110450 RepID=A0A6G1EV12_9ORYZ|nr:hypothetical protein E2562_003257 [Oryza meyeriana var. granulata]
MVAVYSPRAAVACTSPENGGWPGRGGAKPTRCAGAAAGRVGSEGLITAPVEIGGEAAPVRPPAWRTLEAAETAARTGACAGNPRPEGGTNRGGRGPWGNFPSGCWGEEDGGGAARDSST